MTVPLLCGSAAAAQPAAAGDSTAPALVERNPAVRAALEWPRTKPDDAFRAVLALVDLGRPDLAKPILEDLRTRGLTDPQQAGLVEQFGSYRMLQLARDGELAPTGGQFAEACMAAAAAAATNPQRLEILIGQLTDPAAAVRHAARVELVAAGQTGANAVLEALARESDPQRRAGLAAAAARMDPLVDGPLLAMLETNDAALRADVARLLSALGVPQAAPLVTANSALASSASAERAIVDALRQYQGGALPFALDAEGQVELWHWDDDARSLTAARYPADDARTIWMARLAEKLAKWRPANQAYRRQALVLGLEADGLMAKARGGETSSPANGRLQTVDLALVDDVLTRALKMDYAHAAVAAADELGSRGDTSVLITSDALPSPLADALLHPDRRVRFAALRAIMTLDPSSPYPGSSRVPGALAYFARSAGGRDGLVAMPTVAAATDLAGKLAAAGLDGEATNRGADVARLAKQMSDLDLVLIDMDIQAPGIRQVLYELRVTPTATRTPVALLAGEGRLEAAHRLADEHRRVIAVPRPYSAEAVRNIADRLMEISARDAVPADERAAQALQAVTWIAELLQRERTFYALHREAPAIETSLYRSSATGPAIAALARLGTPASQRALVAFAGQRAMPIEGRKQAAAAFHDSVQVRGLLLTRDEILAQYALYNASAHADADTQQVLGAVLDAIESRRAREIGLPPREDASG